jgi:hypothetical protein
LGDPVPKPARDYQPLVRAAVCVLAGFLLGLYLPLAAAQYSALHEDERGMPIGEQNLRNGASYGLILAQIAIHNGLIPIGIFSEPLSSYLAELGNIAADNTLKFTKAFLQAPPDYAVTPSSADLCYYEFDLPQTLVRFDNFLGLWPKLGDDDLFLPNDTPVAFGVLGVPVIFHANTNVDLSVTSASPGIVTIHSGSNTPRQGIGATESSLTVRAEAGIQALEWRADTKWFPVWDLGISTVLATVMFAVEYKYAKQAKQLAASQMDDLVEVASVKGSRELAAQLNRLNQKTGIFQPLAKWLGMTVAQELTGELIVEKFFEGQTTVSRSRNQWLTVYDVRPPTIATSDPNPRFEATDIGGARTSRYFAQLESMISASDACGREVVVTNNAPEYFPLGDTVVTWTVRDLGPTQPGLDRDGDGDVDGFDNYNYRSITQVVTIEDTQAPILVPPPGVVIESTTAIDLDAQPLGQPLVVDLADLHPTVASSTANVDGIVPPDTRTVVTWTATDRATPPNQSAAEQLVTVKTPGTNTAPLAFAQSAETLTSLPVDIVLAGLDNDVLPVTGGAPGTPGSRPDPLQFRIEQLPQNGEFVAPLYPFFINDYRTDRVGGLVEYIESQPDAAQLLASYEDAVARNMLWNWLNEEFCEAGMEAPVDFVFEPMFVHITDEGEQYFFDSGFVCDPNVDSDWDQYPRISRWDKDNNFLGHVRIEDNGGGDVPSEQAVFRIDAENYVYYVNRRTGSETGVVSVQRCPANLTNTSTQPPFCQIQGFGPIDSGDTSSRAQPANAFIDIEREIAYVTVLNGRVDVYDYRREEPDNPANPTRRQVLLGPLVDDAGAVQFGCDDAANRFDNAMEIDSAGNFYVIDNPCNRIHKFTPSYFDEDGQFVRGTYVGWMGQCLGSNNLACDVPNQRTKGFSCTVAAACTMVPPDFLTGPSNAGDRIGQFDNPSFLAVDPNDVIYVADYANQRVQRFATDGTFAGQAQSTGNGINANTDGGFVLGNMGPPKHVSVNSRNFFVVDQSENFVHIFDTSPFKDITDSSATVSYVSNFAFHTATDTFAYSVNDGLVDSNVAQVSVAVARNYRQPLPTAQNVTAFEDRSIVIVLSGTDPDGILQRDFNGLDSLTFSITREPTYGTLTRGGDPGGAVLDPGTEVWTYTPNRDYHGADSLSFTVRDQFTDALTDGARQIPEPYGEAEPVDVVITVNPANDIPILRLDAPERVAAGFPAPLQGTVYDDLGQNYAATVRWGDGSVERNGKVVVDNNGTPSVAEDDAVTFTGVVFNEESLRAIGQTPVTAVHTYASAGNRTITLCMRDSGRLEACERIDVAVQNLVVMNTVVDLSHEAVADGVPFTATIEVANGAPTNGVLGLAASDVVLSLDLPPELVVQAHSASQGSCSVIQSELRCVLGLMANGSSASVGVGLRSRGTLIYDRRISLEAEVTTTTPALSDAAVGSAVIDLDAIELDRDNNGLSNLFEGLYGVSDPEADADADGLSNRAELEAGTSPVEADSDGDGIGDGVETNVHATDPLETDTDGDGLTDNAELFVHGTNPVATDGDADGLADDWELENGFDPRLADSGGDTDGDGLNTAQEREHGTDHLVADSDDDGLSDGQEVAVYETDPAAADTDLDGLADDLELAAGTDQLKPDSDDDGLLDGAEGDLGTDPLSADSDQDGLPDGWETNNGRNPLVADAANTDPDADTITTDIEIQNGTDPLDADTDRDGLADNAEAALATNPREADTDGDGLIDGDEVAVHFANPLSDDSDGDGLPDGWEVEHGLRPLINDAALDGDADGVANSREFSGGSDPNVADSDGDGLDDGVELARFRYADSGQRLGAEPSEAVELGDLDGDGDLDAFVANRTGGSEIWRNDGAGTFTLDALNPLNDAEALDVALADVDGDDDLDAVLAHPTQPNTLWINGANAGAEGLFTVSASTVGQGVSDGVEFGTRFNFAQAGPGLYVANWGRDEVYVFFGGTPLSSLVSDSFAGNSEDVAVGDLNGDGFDDAFVVNRDQPNQVFRNLPDLLDARLLDTGQRLGGDVPSIAVALGDLDGDGDLDAFEVTFGTGNRIWLNNGTGTFSDSGQLLGTDGGNGVELLDVDGDGDLDALVANTGPNKLWLNSGNGTMTDSGQAMGNETSYGVSVGDVDGDGDDDAFFANDGPNSVWRFEQLDPADPDTDGDGAFDGWELENGFDPFADADGDLDVDFDGLANDAEFRADTDPRDADSDNDGMPDGFEVDNGLDATTDDGALDLEGDGTSNFTEFQQGTAPEGDDTPPVVSAPAGVAVSSTGALTAVALGTASATDARDGARAATPSHAGPFPSGRNVVMWSANDVSGNIGSAQQLVDVTPLLDFAVDQIVDEGDTAQVVLQLNGSAVTYPVQIDYSVAGAATNPADHNAASGSVSLASGTVATIPIAIVADNVFEGPESFTLTIANAVNAVPGTQRSHTVTITQANLRPNARIIATQGGVTVTTATANGGPITITGVVTDRNVGDIHTYDWSGSDSAIFNPADYADASYSIDPSGLARGIYRLRLSVADNGAPIGMNSATALLRIEPTAHVLSSSFDTDRDGTNDAAEGAGDADNDGVPNHLDPNGPANVLPHEAFLLETQAGLSFHVGEQAFAYGAGASVPESALGEDVQFGYPNGVADFEIHDIEPGSTARVVVPLRYSIPTGAVYRKHRQSSWADFVVDAENSIASAPGGNGACPAPGHASYTAGLNRGAGCIELRLEDGGPNDADGSANGVIRDPGGLAVPVQVALEVLPNVDKTAYGTDENVVAFRLRLVSDSGDVELQSLTIAATGTGDDRQIERVNVFVDADGDGSVDSDEGAIASGTFDQNDGTLRLQMSAPYSVPAGQTNLLVTYDF